MIHGSKFTLENPLPKAVRDTGKLREFAKKFNVEPYFGSSAESAHSALNVLFDLHYHSPSHGTCVNDICSWAFEGLVDVVQRGVDGLLLDSDEAIQVDPQTKIRFAETLSEIGVKLPQIIELTKQLWTSYQIFGTAYMKYKEVTVLGVKKVFIERLTTKDVILLQADNVTEEEREILVVEDYSVDAVKEGRYEILKVFPYMDVEANGDRTTVFVLKNQTDDGSWYGRPPSYSSLFYQFVEYLQGDHACKVTATDLVSFAVMFIQNKPYPANQENNGDQDSEIIELAKKINAKFTQKGKFSSSQGIGVIGYPHGVNEPTMEKLEVNRDTNWAKLNSERASDFIYASMRWSKELSGLSSARGGIGSDILKNLFQIRQVGTINQEQTLMERFLLEPTRMMFEYANSEDLAEYRIGFIDRIGELIEKLSGSDASKMEDSLVDVNEIVENDE